MDYRTESFKKRFISAEAHLGIRAIQELVSLKYRDQPVNSSEYSQFINEHLRRDLGLSVTSLNGDFGGQAWLVKDKAGNRAILVEHETGLEVLYIAGSVASLVALIPMISAGWARMRRRVFRHRPDLPYADGVEIRKFDRTGSLVESLVPTVEVHVLSATINDYDALKQRVEQLETEIHALKQENPVRKRNPVVQSNRKKSKNKRKKRK